MTSNGSAAASMGVAAGRKLRPLGTPRIPVPTDFVAQAKVKHLTALARHYGVTWDTIKRWCRRTGASPIRSPNLGSTARPAPDDFVRPAPSLTRAQLKDRYGVSEATILRWIKATGAQPKPVKTTVFRVRRLDSAFMPPVDGSTAAQAAQFLRRFYPAVYSCEILTPQERAKLPDRGKGLYVVGHRKDVPAAEVIALAETKGFDQRAWAKI